MSFVVPDEVLFRDLEGESVLLHLGSGNYFGLDDIGTFIWNHISGGCPLEVVEEKLLAEFDADAQLIRRDLARLIQELCENGLLAAAAANA